MSAEQQKIYGLIGVAEEQQAAAASVIAELAAERAALAAERAALSKERAALAAEVAGARGTIERAVEKALGGAGATAGAAADAVAQPIIEHIKKIRDESIKAHGSVQSIYSAMDWMILIKGVAVFVAVVVVATTGFSIASGFASDNLTKIRSEAAAMEMTVKTLEQRGGGLVLEECGARLCVEISPNQEKKWKTADGRLLAIPKGY